jgi:hypothetical protein
MGRNTQGVTLMKVDEGDRIVSVGMIEPDENGAPPVAPDSPSEPPPESPPPPPAQ